jgi:hypothetical protein
MTSGPVCCGTEGKAKMAAANGAVGAGMVSNGMHPQSNGTYESVQDYYGRVT